MRKGKLLIVEKSSIREENTYFDTLTKKVIDIVKINDGMIMSWETSTRTAQEPINSIGINPDRFVELSIEDEITGEIFPLDELQQPYVFKSENRDRLQFMTVLHRDKNIAIVMAKDMNMQHAINRLAPIANFYGQYVAQQKTINEPCKSIEDWYFIISV